MVAYLQKSEGSEGFHQIIDFMNASHIQYALTENPTIYVSFITQFWRTATAITSANGEVELTATIDGQVKTITEASLRRHLKLEDNGGVTTLPNSEIFEQLALMGYVTDSDKLTFQKGHFSPQWSNMKWISKGYSGVDIPLFPTMISAPETSPSKITSSPSLSPQHTVVSTPSTSQPPNTQSTPTAEEAAPMPIESPLHSVHSLRLDEGGVSLNELTDICTSLYKKVGALENELQQTKKTYSTAITKLILRGKKLEQKVKTTKARRRARIVLSKDEEDVEDSSKQGRKISEIDTDPSISLVQDEGPSWFQEGSGEKGEKEVSTVGAEHSTVIPEVNTANIAVTTAEVSTAAENLVAEQLNEEETQRIARDAEIARQLQEEINKATQEQEKQEVVAEADPTHVID
ncbi:hypothetical protein Tco_0971841 [Tanacetum coccineum]